MCKCREDIARRSIKQTKNQKRFYTFYFYKLSVIFDMKLLFCMYACSNFSEVSHCATFASWFLGTNSELQLSSWVVRKS